MANITYEHEYSVHATETTRESQKETLDASTRRQIIIKRRRKCVTQVNIQLYKNFNCNTNSKSNNNNEKFSYVNKTKDTNRQRERERKGNENESVDKSFSALIDFGFPCSFVSCFLLLLLSLLLLLLLLLLQLLSTRTT